MAIFETVLKSDLKKPVQVKQLSGNLFSGDNQGNKITVEVMDNGSPATLSGGVTGYVIREDNSTVIISSGTLSGNKASIVLPEKAYNVIGRVSIVVKVGTTTVGACTAYVYRTSTDTLVDPTGAIPSLHELLAKISACEQATADANKVANLTVSAEAATGSTPDAVLIETGSPAHKHITFKLVKGDKGDTGNTGATPQLSIGTVTTLQPSQDATVTITGTDEEPVLNFGIPQGASGNETIDDTAGIGDTDLVYSADKVRKELNTKAPVVDVHLTTPASVQSFPDGADELPMALTVGIEPVQDLHGYDNPWPAGGGKNKLEITGNSKTLNGITYTIRSDGTIEANGTNSGSAAWIHLCPNTDFNKLGLVSGQTYILSCEYLSSREAYIYIETTGDQHVYEALDGEVQFTYNGETNWRVCYLVANANIMNHVILHPMIRLASESDDTWEPYSNICPISGWTGAKVTRTGKNLLSDNWLQAFLSTSDGYYATSNSYWVYNPDFIKLSSEAAIFSAKENNKAIVFEYDRNKNFIRAIQVSDGNNSKIISSVDGAYYVRVAYNVSGASEVITPTSVLLKEPQVEFGSTATTYEPYQGEQYQLTFPTSAGTVYGGTLTVNKDGSGSLVVDRKRIEFDGATDGKKVTQVGSRSDSDPYNFYLPLNDGYLFGGTARWLTNAEMLENGFVYSHGPIEVAPSQSYRLAAYVGGGGTVLQPRMFIPLDEGIDTVAKCNEWLAEQYTNGTPVQYVYPIATPVTYSLTPGQVKTLLGVNNLFADCGNITEVRYPADTKLYVDQQIADKISASQRLMELIVTANHEDEMKATKAYSKDELLIVNGTLYKATASIANGANLTVNTNVTATTVAAELAALV